MKLFWKGGLVCILAFHATFLMAGSGRETPEDFLILPGKQIGKIKGDTTEADLARIFGLSHLKSEKEDNPEDIDHPIFITRVFPDDPQKVIVVYWKNASGGRRIDYVTVAGDRSLWHLTQDVRPGKTCVADLEKLNGKPFLLSAASWDEASHVASWKRGSLETALPLRDLRLYFTLPSRDSKNPAKVAEFVKVLNAPILSNAPALLKYKPCLFSIDVRLSGSFE